MEELPENCMGQEQSTRCIYYEKTNEPLDTVIERLDSAVDISDIEGIQTATTDEIITTSLVRSPSSSCAAKIIERSFKYTLTAETSSSSFSWNLTNIISSLPADYSLSLVRVLATGSKVGGSSTVFDSNRLSAGLPVELSRYPITVDFTLRIASPCGDVEMNKRIYLSSPAQKGTFVNSMSVNGLMPGAPDEMILTNQLNIIESNIQLNTQRINSFEKIDVNGAEIDVNQAIAIHSGQINELEKELSEYEANEYSYDKNGVKTTEIIATVFADLYNEIESLKNDLAQKGAEIETLQAQVASLQA